jgi:hypothetical protein
MRFKFSHFLALALMLFTSVSVLPIFHVSADEGMFMPDAVAKIPFDKVAKRGMKLKPTDIYNPNGVSLKDAIVRVEIAEGGFGTGEFVSPNGLVLTNHHVAFDALVAASTPEKNYGELGYKANSQAEELPAKGYKVRMTLEMKDVTADVLSAVKPEMPPQARNAAIRAKVEEIEKANAGNEADGIEVGVERMTEGLFYYLFKYQIFRDVRIAYAPPKSIGFFGGDPDNFEWPRHCGDFTFMRVYAGPDGKPADYSTNNVPYKPKKFLSLSMEGVKENDFVFVMGYPGGTRRYRESYSIAYNQDHRLPLLIDLFTTQIELLRNVGKYDEAKRVELQSRIFSLSNSLKSWEGDVLAMRRANLVDRKKTEEAEFKKWLDAGDPARKAKYGEALPNLEKAYADLGKTEEFNNAVTTLYNTNFISLIPLAFIAAGEKEKPENERNGFLLAALAQAKQQVPGIMKQRLVTYEREMLKYALRKAAEPPAGQKIEAVEKRFGNLKGDARLKAEEEFARSIVDSKLFSSAEELVKFMDLSQAQMRALNEPVVQFAVELDAENDKAQEAQQRFNQAIVRWRPIFFEGIREMRGINYPDANATLRFTFGSVQGYVPREAMIYKPFTYAFGVVEKDTGREPFDVPAKLKQLYRDKDFGTYSPDGKDVPVNFLSNTDIIGGNSGSPIMNGKGEQVGIVFDGNFEGLGNDFFYSPERGRTISVDIRYVLFVADKFGGAGWVLKELDIKGMKK